MLAKANAYWSTNGLGSHTFYPMHPKVTMLSNMARALWFAGSPQEAVQRISEAVQFARELGHARAEAYAMAIAADIAHWRRDTTSTLEWCEQATNLALKCELFYELTWASLLRAWAFSESNEPEKALPIFEKFIPGYAGPSSTQWRTHYAEALGKVGKVEEALRALDGARRFRADHEEHFFDSEMSRTMGDLLLRRAGQGRADQAEAWRFFKKSVEISKRQQAKSCELRAATSLLRFTLTYRPQDAIGARQALRTMCDSFRGIALSPDLLAAQELMAS